ncbi:hypothetical protein OIDMADRAFT_123732 [Oidiodendron maius Zn]|uniref:Arrestin C-terminal-like domain-containing protein n=1 Tax=Oidiodendron maius (strain Zn) TaxID=913774 RepID=A0A0C3GZ69_OIDMZ|nr:hypothetical protein OIDMADRAFT_123732 [Oidiodendron maius Zn]
MPSFKPFGGVTGRTSATLFEIRLDSEVIILRGVESEAASQLLKGVVVLCLPAALKVEDVHLRMTGHLKLGWTDQRPTASGLSTHRVDKSIEIFNHLWPPFVSAGGSGSSSKGVMLPSGNYEWPFELVVNGSMAESIEGLADSHITYKLKATVARGKLVYDLHAYKPLRIVRTLDPAALELAHAMTVENIWPNKIEYQLVIPQKAIVFGTSIPLEMRFTSLLKGLKIGQIKCVLFESQEFTLPGTTASSADKYHKHTRAVQAWEFELNDEEHYQDILDENGQDGYYMQKSLPLPKKLSKCLQDAEACGIKIRHRLRATLPVTIFISPNMPLNSDGCLVDQTPHSTQSVDIASHAPPLYGEHILDQLYAGMDQPGLITPAPQSGMNTPFYNHSQTGSSENLASINQPIDLNGVITPAALSSRLQNLDITSRNSSFTRMQQALHSGGNTPHPEAGSSNSPHPAAHGNVLSRRTSEEEEHNSGVSNLTSGQHTPEHIDYSELGDLSKVPSYSTAVRAPIPSTTSPAALPDYEAAVSAPASPNLNLESPVSPDIGNYSDRSRRPPSGLHVTDIEETRRLHLLQRRDGAR